jgi:hypothetical protein
VSGEGIGLIGNFTFESLAQYSSMNPEVVIVRLTFGDRQTRELVRLVLDDQGLPDLCRGAETAMRIEMERHRSQPYKTEIEGRDGITSVALG